MAMETWWLEDVRTPVHPNAFRVTWLSGMRRAYAGKSGNLTIRNWCTCKMPLLKRCTCVFASPPWFSAFVCMANLYQRWCNRGATLLPHWLHHPQLWKALDTQYLLGEQRGFWQILRTTVFWTPGLQHQWPVLQTTHSPEPRTQSAYKSIESLSLQFIWYRLCCRLEEAGSKVCRYTGSTGKDTISFRSYGSWVRAKHHCVA